MRPVQPVPDVHIVGAGAVGVAVALELASRGASVTILERGAAPGAGCSSGNAGVVGPGHVEPLAVPQAVWEGLRCLPRRDSPFALDVRRDTLPWLTRFVAAAYRSRSGAGARRLRELAVESDALHRELGHRYDVGLQERGMLSVYETPAALRAAHGHAAEPGAPRREVLDAAATMAACPQLSREPAGAIFTPDDAHCDPARFVSALARAAGELGVKVRTGVEIHAMRRRGSRIESLTTSSGELAAGEVVLAAGAWSGRLVAGLPVRLPIQGGKGYHIDLHADAADTRLPTYFPERRVVATPLDGRLRITGMLQLAGTDMSIDRNRVDAISRHAGQLLSGVAGRPVLDVWGGLRPCSPDGLPMIGRVSQLENLVMATGHGMWGLQLAPVTARLVADTVASTSTDIQDPALSPERFGRPRPRLRARRPVGQHTTPEEEEIHEP